MSPTQGKRRTVGPLFTAVSIVAGLSFIVFELTLKANQEPSDSIWINRIALWVLSATVVILLVLALIALVQYLRNFRNRNLY